MLLGFKNKISILCLFLLAASQLHAEKCPVLEYPSNDFYMVEHTASSKWDFDRFVTLEESEPEDPKDKGSDALATFKRTCPDWKGNIQILKGDGSNNDDTVGETEVVSYREQTEYQNCFAKTYAVVNELSDADAEEKNALLLYEVLDDGDEKVGFIRKVEDEKGGVIFEAITEEGTVVATALRTKKSQESAEDGENPFWKVSMTPGNVTSLIADPRIISTFIGLEGVYDIGAGVCNNDGSTPCSTGCSDMVAILAVFGAIGVLSYSGVNIC